jgi:hypothetical protein
MADSNEPHPLLLPRHLISRYLAACLASIWPTLSALLLAATGGLEALTSGTGV